MLRALKTRLKSLLSSILSLQLQTFQKETRRRDKQYVINFILIIKQLATHRVNSLKYQILLKEIATFAYSTNGVTIRGINYNKLWLR